ncbi:MAG: ATP-dependent RecD-like DNA helicase, partial [Bacillales bacterium]|nr:ATP-dependent RecD-like DNA helicase [Bacillales bacterium]
NKFSYDENNPLGTTILIIDELSMVDLTLFYRLLLAGRFIKKLILIGDHEQLPPILPGDILKDFINSKKLPVITLNRIFRQEGDGNIIPFTYAIRNFCQIDVDLFNGNDLLFIPKPPLEITGEVVNIVGKLVDLGFNFYDIQILAPMYEGSSGINELNNRIQEKFNPKNNKLKDVQIDKYIYRLGDKILQLKNQPEDEIYNGDIGTLIKIDKEDGLVLTIDFEGNEVEIKGDKLENIALAYAVSIHKSQGSEYPIVIVVISKDSYHMLRKDLIYTAFTRAKIKLIIVGDLPLLQRAVSKTNKAIEKTLLPKRLKNAFELLN